MIVGIGIDTIEIDRFAQWHTYTDRMLARILSQIEIDYCRSSPSLSAARFAVRFAAREAAYKAYCQAFPSFTPPFLTFCKMVTITHDSNHAPVLNIDKKALPIGHEITIAVTHLISLSHSKGHAIAMVVVQKYPGMVSVRRPESVGWVSNHTKNHY